MEEKKRWGKRKKKRKESSGFFSAMLSNLVMLESECWRFLKQLHFQRQESQRFDNRHFYNLVIWDTLKKKRKEKKRYLDNSVVSVLRNNQLFTMFNSYI